jgi:hypothetical protein
MPTPEEPQYPAPIINPVPPMNFVLEAFESIVTLDVSGNIYSELVAALDVSAVAVMYMHTSALKNTFKFQTDSTDIENSDANDIRYYVDSATWPLYNPANALLHVDGISQNPIATVDSTGNDFAPNKMMVAHDFVRYLAKELFNTHFGVDLFDNESELLQSVRRVCGNSESGQTLFDILKVLKDVDIYGTNGDSGNAYLTPDASNNHYLTNEVATSDNICRAIFNQMIDPSGVNRFSDIISGITSGPAGVPQSLPFVDGDSLSYKLTIHPADGQENLVGLASPFGSRSYEIRIVLVPDSTVVNPALALTANIPADPAELEIV